MSRKGVLIGLAVAVFVGLSAVGLLMTDASPTAGWMIKARGIRDAAETYAASATTADCVLKADALGEDCPRLMVGCATRANLFAYWCLDAAAPSDGLCDDVPRSTEIFGTRDWMIERCGVAGRDEACGAIAATLQRHCDQQRGR